MRHDLQMKSTLKVPLCQTNWTPAMNISSDHTMLSDLKPIQMRTFKASTHDHMEWVHKTPWVPRNRASPSPPCNQDLQGTRHLLEKKGLDMRPPSSDSQTWLFACSLSALCDTSVYDLLIMAGCLRFIISLLFVRTATPRLAFKGYLELSQNALHVNLCVCWNLPILPLYLVYLNFKFLFSEYKEKFINFPGFIGSKFLVTRWGGGSQNLQ